MTLRAHRDAVVSALEVSLPGAVFTSYAVSDAPSRYAVVFIRRAAIERARYMGPQSRDLFTVTVHSVGGDEDQALWVQERVDQLTGRVLEVSGRALWPVEYVTGMPPELDDDSTSPLVFTVSQFDIVSDPVEGFHFF